mmetsp:Transcript_29339/g.66399  ORF Transcript_29339/g.66399 Transcript_29339/m.66399 type:complete len:110 (+) Transcript_29339:570-899(+)
MKSVYSLATQSQHVAASGVPFACSQQTRSPQLLQQIRQQLHQTVGAGAALSSSQMEQKASPPHSAQREAHWRLAPQRPQKARAHAVQTFARGLVTCPLPLPSTGSDGWQ